MAKTKEFTNLLRSEIKKAERKANEATGTKDCKVTGWSWDGLYETLIPGDDLRWAKVICEICHNYEERAEVDIELYIPMYDRRRTFATVA